MTELTLHHVPWSRSFRILWLIEELGLTCQVVPYDIRAGNMQGPAFKALSPAARVPALSVGDLTIFESGAITQYLAETFRGGALGRAAGSAERVRYLEGMHFAETTAAIIEQLNLNHVFLRDPVQASPVVIKVNTARLKGTMTAMEAMLGDQDYMLPSGFSAMDTMMGFNLFAAPYYVRLDGFPRLAAYKARIEVRPAYRRAAAQEPPQDFYTRDFYPVPGLDG